MKKAFLVLLVAGALLLSACGGSSSSTGKPKSGLSSRAFVTNYYAGTVNVLDAKNDKVTSFYQIVGGNPTTIYTSPDTKTSLVYNSGSASVSVIDNTTEAVNYTISFVRSTDSIALASDNKMGFAAQRNVLLSGFAAGAVQAFNYSDNSIATFIPVANASYVAVDHSGKHLLVFSDLPTNVGGTPLTWNAYWVDLTKVDYTQSIQDKAVPIFGLTLNRPVAAFFSADDTKAYIVECGTECGGSNPAGVTEVATATISDTTAPTTRTVVSPATGTTQWGARLGLLYNANTLWLTGSPEGAGGSAVSVDLTAMTASTTPFEACSGTANTGCVSDGTKVLMRQLNNKIFIGSKNCTTSSCLTVIDPAATTATLGKPANAVSPNLGDVTGATYITPRNMYYLIEGGQIYLYDSNYNQKIVDNFDLTGALYDVSYVD